MFTPRYSSRTRYNFRPAQPAQVTSSVTADDLRAAAQSSRLAADKQVICRDLAAKLDRYGSFYSVKQADFAASLVRQSRQEPSTATLAGMESFLAVKHSLDAAFGRGIKKPALHIHPVSGAGLDTGFKFSRAPDAGRNPGMVYVTIPSSTRYLGKISPDGTFTRGRDCEDAHLEGLRWIAADPLEAARNSGKMTGRCSCCGRELSDPVSIQNGIGPICEAKYFGSER